MPLIVLRHTRPDVAWGVCYGRSDVGLAADFDAAAQRIAGELPAVSRIVSSPLARSRRLAEAIGVARGLDVEVEPAIQELDFGAWELKRWDAIAPVELNAWSADFHGARPHGGESVGMLAERVGAALDRTPRADPPVLWVTHSGVIRAVCARLGRAKGWETDVGFGEWLDLSAGGRAGSEARPREDTT